ncbi:MAG: NfeD family protein [Chloroflexi bacterium]|nr:NfeD family protein [Chloroflexota bacterium]
MPVAGAVVFFVAPPPISIPVYGSIAGTSLFVYWKIAKALMLPPVMGREGMIGRVAEVVTDVDSEGSEGMVRFDGALWQAVSEEKLPKGEEVRIIGLDGMKLLVERVHSLARFSVLPPPDHP